MKNKKGFTLIELLAVIVILGLLMAIAIPSVTKYITQSRKKTTVTSIDGYVSSVVNAVNDQDYSFSAANKIYAIPIECVALEKGGTNPFGEWLQANDDYWAYVLVQYNPEDFSYTYGFTFKDSGGYGMYPTVLSEINPKSSTQIKTGLNWKKPKSGIYSTIASKDDWTGFDIQDNTQVVVLESTEDTADGKYTCSLSQKGDNYEQVKAEQESTVIKTMNVKYAGSIIQYQYEEGMTWGEWLNSKYNTTSFDYDGRLYSRNIAPNGNMYFFVYDCPVITDKEAKFFVRDVVDIDHPIFEEETYHLLTTYEFDMLGEFLVDSVDELQHYIFKKADGTYEYVKN